MRCGCLGLALAGMALAVGSAQAGGFSRGTADADILYEEGGFNFRAGITYVAPSQDLRSAPLAAPMPGLVGTNYLDNYVIPSLAVKFSFSPALSCAATYTDAYGASSSHPLPYGPAGKLHESFTIAEFGATCAAFIDAGPGRLAILGGGFVEQFDYELESVFGGMVPLDASLKSNAYGWRAGLGYEVPEIALRAQLMYRSGTTHSATGTARLGSDTLPAVGHGELPQSVDLSLRTGIAPGWLAFGSVRWTDWSVNERLVLGVPLLGLESENQYYWRDGWTVTAGIGHAFSDNLSGQMSLTWDRGVSTGYDLRGERWTLAAGGSFTDTLGGELRFGAGVSHLASVEITQGHNIGAAVDSGWALALSAGYSVRW